jgi:hypothetical protein
LTAASFIPSPALAEQTLSGRGDFILTLVNLFSVFIIRRLADHVLAMRRTFTRPIGRPVVQGANLFPLERLLRIIGQNVSPARRSWGSSRAQAAEEVADRSFEAFRRFGCRSGWAYLSAHLARASSAAGLSRRPHIDQPLRVGNQASPMGDAVLQRHVKSRQFSDLLLRTFAASPAS